MRALTPPSAVDLAERPLAARSGHAKESQDEQQRHGEWQEEKRQTTRDDQAPLQLRAVPVQGSAVIKHELCNPCGTLHFLKRARTDIPHCVLRQLLPVRRTREASVDECIDGEAREVARCTHLPPLNG